MTRPAASNCPCGSVGREGGLGLSGPFLLLCVRGLSWLTPRSSRWVMGESRGVLMEISETRSPAIEDSDKGQGKGQSKGQGEGPGKGQDRISWGTSRSTEAQASLCSPRVSHSERSECAQERAVCGAAPGQQWYCTRTPLPHTTHRSVLCPDGGICPLLTVTLSTGHLLPHRSPGPFCHMFCPILPSSPTPWVGPLEMPRSLRGRWSGVRTRLAPDLREGSCPPVQRQVKGDQGTRSRGIQCWA